MRAAGDTNLVCDSSLRSHSEEWQEHQSAQMELWHAPNPSLTIAGEDLL